MKTKNFGGRLRKALPCWFGWGCACGMASLACALAFEVSDWPGMGAMVAGIATWSLVCAGCAASEAYVRHVEPGAWGKALRMALRLRVGAMLAGFVLFLPGHFWRGWDGAWMLMVAPDLYAGIGTIRLVQFVWTACAVGGGDQTAGFGFVYVATLVQGAWVVTTLLGLTAVLRLFFRADEKAFASGEGGADPASP